MTGEGEEPSRTLRIGRWLPPIEPLAAPATEDLPQLEAGVATHIMFVREATWIPPIMQPPLGEQPAHRRSTIGMIRSRAIVLFAIAAGAGIPLVLGMAGAPSGLQSGLGAGVPPAYANPAPDVPSAPVLRSTDATSPSASPSVPSPTVTSTNGPAPAATTAQIGSNTPSPTTPSVVPVHVSLEAEGQMTQREGTAVPRALADASGGVVVTGIGDGPGNVVRFANITVPEAANYTVTFHYVATKRLRARVIVNGDVRMFQFPATGGEWGTLDAVSVRVPLKAGSNIIEFGNKNDPAPDLDRMVITR